MELLPFPRILEVIEYTPFFELPAIGGLSINKLIVATNENDILQRVINTGEYKPDKVKPSISPSMDIQVASNFERLIFDIFSYNTEKTVKLMEDLNEKGEFKLEKDDLNKINKVFCSDSLSEDETKLVIKSTYKNYGSLIDPHTAVAIGVANKIKLKGDTVILSTAHPAKFSDVVTQETSITPELPEKLKDVLIQKEKYIKLPNDLKVKEVLKKEIYLVSKHSVREESM